MPRLHHLSWRDNKSATSGFDAMAIVFRLKTLETAYMVLRFQNQEFFVRADFAPKPLQRAASLGCMAIQYAAPMGLALAEVPKYGFMGERAHIKPPTLPRDCRAMVIGSVFYMRKDVPRMAADNRFFTLPTSKKNKLCINPTHGYHSPHQDWPLAFGLPLKV